MLNVGATFLMCFGAIELHKFKLARYGSQKVSIFRWSKTLPSSGNRSRSVSESWFLLFGSSSEAFHSTDIVALSLMCGQRHSIEPSQTTQGFVPHVTSSSFLVRESPASLVHSINLNSISQPPATSSSTLIRGQPQT